MVVTQASMTTIMKVFAIDNPADTKPLDLAKFTAELKELTARHDGIKLVSIGAMSGRLDVGGDGAIKRRNGANSGIILDFPLLVSPSAPMVNLSRWK